jgi:nucleoid-associated protein YgaU
MGLHLPNLETGKLAKAYLRIHEPKGATTGARIGEIAFTFNPSDFTISRGARWSMPATKESAVPEYGGIEPARLSVKVFLDASAGGDVTRDVKRLLTCLEPTDSTKHSKNPTPPYVVFGWGPNTYLTAVVTSVNVAYKRFRADGAPIRATADLSLTEVVGKQAGQNPTSGAIDDRSSRVLRSGDSLASIANEDLGTPAGWRDIAEANGIDDPFRMTIGRHLVVPRGEGEHR